MHNKGKVIEVVDNHCPAQNEFWDLVLDQPRYTITIEGPKLYSNGPNQIKTIHLSHIEDMPLGPNKTFYFLGKWD